MKYHNLFWDFDGTLYNSYPQVQAALQNALTALGAPPAPEKEALALLKVSVYHAVTHYAALDQLDTQLLLDRFHVEHAKVGFFPPYDGLRECLEALRGAGAAHYLYTHRDQKAWAQLRRDGLDGLFSGGVTSEDGYPMKPAPDALLALMERYHLSPEDCAMIGDRDIDVQSGQNAGMAGVLFDPDGFYEALPVEARVRSMAELQRTLLEEK